MMRSMFSGVSGLRNHQTKMDVIGNNIANINTAGFKKSRVVFSDAFYQSLKSASSPGTNLGGTNPMGVGTGVVLGSIDQIHTPAPTMTTNKNTDMAVNGDGYFIIRDGLETYYTRAGAFEFDVEGNLVNPSNGYHVQGWNATYDPVTGSFDIKPDPGNMSNIDISDLINCNHATSNIHFAGNLNSALSYTIPKNEIQILTFATPTGGTAGGKFQLTLNGEKTAWIEVGNTPADTAGNIEEALVNLSSIDSGDVKVSWNPLDQNYEIKFQGNLAATNVGQLEIATGPLVAFGGNVPPINVVGTTKDQTLSFTCSPNSGNPGSAFTLTFNKGGTYEETTDPILIGYTTDETAANIKAAIEATNFGQLYGVNSVKWDDPPDSKTFNISFKSDPGMFLEAVPVQEFGGGTATISTLKEGLRPFGIIPVNEVQRLKFAVDADNSREGVEGGHFRLTYNNQNTEWIQIGKDTTETAQNIRTALEGLSGIGTDNVQVSWNEEEEAFDITFQNQMGYKDLEPLVFTPGSNIEFGITDDKLVEETIPGNSTTPEVQTINLKGADEGAFTLTYNGQSSGPIVVGATATEVTDALEDYISELDGNIIVNKTATGYTIEFTGTLANQDVSLLTLRRVEPYTGGNAVTETVTQGVADVPGPPAVPGVPEVQTLKIAMPSGGNEGGYIRLQYEGRYTRWIKIDSDTTKTALRIQNALNENTGNFTPNASVDVSYDGTNENYGIVFRDNGDQQQIVVEKGPDKVFNPEVNEIITETTKGSTTNLEVQTLELDGANKGNYALTYNGVSTGPISVYATAIEIQQALEEIPELTGNISVNGDVGGPFTFTFSDKLANINVPDITVKPLNPCGIATPVADLLTPKQGTIAETPAESYIIAENFYDTIGNSVPVYFRFFKYLVEPGSAPDMTPTNQPVTRWGCDISLSPLFEQQDGYVAAKDFCSRDINGVQNDIGNGEKLMRVYNLEFDENGNIKNGNTIVQYSVNRQNDDGNTIPGSKNMQVTIDFSKLSQKKSESSAKVVTQDGYALGSLKSLSVGIDGVITGAYDNGTTKSLAQVALATFQNPSGLNQVGGTLFQESANSGKANSGAPCIQGRGKIAPSSLEMSNVDLSEEFTDMIVTQRGFQANSRIITTSDEMLQELVNLKR